MIKLTDLARNKILEVRESEKRGEQGLRVEVRQGGTHQVQYALNFVADGDERDDDVVVDAGGLDLHIDPESAKYLEGATLDYVDGLTESGFKVDAPHAGPPVPSGPLAERVQKVIDERINPAVASHGGVVNLVGLRDDTAYLRFGGGCQGCGMVNVTLKQGVEVMIKEEVPEISQVMDVTDHADGKNPYYQPAK